MKKQTDTATGMYVIGKPENAAADWHALMRRKEQLSGIPLRIIAKTS